MDSLFPYSDVQYFVAAKLCFFLFIELALIGIYRHWKLTYFLVIGGVLSAVAYFFFVRHLGLMFWGLQGDEITIAAMYEMFAHGSLWSDFAYPSLPPFYPPLFFQVFGLLSRFFDWHGVQIAKVAAFTTIATYPTAFYWLQAHFWKKEQLKADIPGMVAWFFSAILLFVFTDWDATILKPYELVSASLTILWTIFLLYRLWHQKFGGRDIFIFAVTGGILFMFFYFWFCLAAIAIALFHLFYQRVPGRHYAILAAVGCGMLLVAVPFWFPLAQSYARAGSENWQFGFLSLSSIATHGPALVFSVRGLLMLFALATLLVYRNIFYVRVLLSFFVSSYVWQVMGMVTILLFATPIQEVKGFSFFQHAILALAGAYGIERLWGFLTSRYPSARWVPAIPIGVTLLFATQLFFGFFVDDPVAQRTRLIARSPRAGVLPLVDVLRARDEHVLTLHSGITELYAFMPVNTFVYYNMHNSHPAAHFSERLALVEALASAKDSAEFFHLTVENPFGSIGRFIFFNTSGDTYPLYFHVDNFPNQSKEYVVRIPKRLLNSAWFERVYESDQFVVFEPQ